MGLGFRAGITWSCGGCEGGLAAVVLGHLENDAGAWRQ